jgi:hypothetical protein
MRCVYAVDDPGAAATAALMVVVILVVMTVAAVTWSRHGLTPTKGSSVAFGLPRPVRRRFERWSPNWAGVTPATIQPTPTRRKAD